MSARREASQIYIKQLSLTEKQNDDVRALYQRGEIYSKKFDPQSAEEQMAAASLLAEIALDEESRGLSCNQWSEKWSSRSGGSGNTTTRVLYQCNCGYNHTEAGSKTRHHNVPFTACLVHAEVTYQVETDKILYIRGHFAHNEECKKAIPVIPSNNNEAESNDLDAPIEDDGPDSTTLRAHRKTGTEALALSRVLSELESMTPRLMQLARSLQGAHISTAEEYRSVTVIKSAIDLLQAELTRLLSEYHPSDSTSVHPPSTELSATSQASTAAHDSVPSLPATSGLKRRRV